MRIFLEIVNLYSICDHNCFKKNIDVMNDDKNRGSMLLNNVLQGNLDAVAVVI